MFDGCAERDVRMATACSEDQCIAPWWATHAIMVNDAQTTLTAWSFGKWFQKREVLSGPSDLPRCWQIPIQVRLPYKLMSDNRLSGDVPCDSLIVGSTSPRLNFPPCWKENKVGDGHILTEFFWFFAKVNHLSWDPKVRNSRVDAMMNMSFSETLLAHFTVPSGPA
jgi:hypothetical protein